MSEEPQTTTEAEEVVAETPATEVEETTPETPTTEEASEQAVDEAAE